MLPPAAKRAGCTPMDAGDRDCDGVCLPYDVLLDILRRLPCRAVAQSRVICLVDDNGLLPRFFSSRSFPGVSTNHTGCQDRSYFLAPPASRSTGGDFWHGWARVGDHCNGLLLLHDDKIRFYGDNDESYTYVCNPATVQCDPLPRQPAPWAIGFAGEDNFIELDNNATNTTSLEWISYCGIIGLHPHKDVLLLNISGIGHLKDAIFELWTSQRAQRWAILRHPGCIPLSSLLRRHATHGKNTLPSKHS